MVYQDRAPQSLVYKDGHPINEVKGFIEKLEEKSVKMDSILFTKYRLLINSLEYARLKRDKSGLTVLQHSYCLRGPKADIEWEERSKAFSIIMRGGYIGTVVADIVLSPIYPVYSIIKGPVK